MDKHSTYRIEPSTEINYRVDFDLLCNARGVRYAAEIGVDKGSFASYLVRRFTGEQLLCIDPYAPYPEMPWDRTADMLQAVLYLQPHYEKIRFIRATSTVAANTLPPWMRQLIDFVYIDANHEYDSVQQDINTWWNVITPTGILAGHDYDPSHPGVVQAVQEFSIKTKSIIRLTSGDPIPSWYTYKTEPDTLYQRYFNSSEHPNPHHK